MRRQLIATILFVFAWVTGIHGATASTRLAQPPVIDIEVNITDQEMYVDLDGSPYASWKVSTARDGYYTPRGSYSVKRLARRYFSQKYDNAPMHYAVFFKGGYAIHATDYVRALGRPASHGCVRLHPANAARLFALVQQYGMSRTRIRLTD